MLVLLYAIRVIAYFDAIAFSVLGMWFTNCFPSTIPLKSISGWVYVHFKVNLLLKLNELGSYFHPRSIMARLTSF
jgi:hypothetical protein